MVDDRTNFAKPRQTCRNESEPNDTDRKTRNSSQTPFTIPRTPLQSRALKEKYHRLLSFIFSDLLDSKFVFWRHR